MSDFDLDTFLKNHKPKSLTKFLAPYMNHRKLKGYSLLENDNLLDITPRKTYIRYIDIDNAVEGEFRSSHIKVGGILLNGGNYNNNKFVKSEDHSAWKFLKLKFDPSRLVDKNNNVVRERKSKEYVIRMSKYYIFYKNFDNSFRDYLLKHMEKIDVELVETKKRR